MNAKQIIREKLGLSQKAFAQYLGIPSSQLAMYEAGKRDLPMAVLVKLAEIELVLNQEQSYSEEKNILTKKQESIIQEMLVYQTKELKYKLIKEQRVLEGIVKKYNQSVNLYYFAKSTNNNNLIQNEILHQQAINGIENNGLAVQLKQELKIKNVNFQLEYIEKIII
jgi:transcriptional regulator with XRE-family HTH domain